MKSNRLNICFITEDFYPDFIGGQGIYGYKLVSHLAKKSHHVWVIAEKRGERSKFWSDAPNIKLLLTPFCFGNQILLSIFEYFLFRRRLSEVNFDVVHANQLSGLMFVLSRPKNIKKIIVSAHNTNFDMSQKTQSLFKKLLYQPLIFLERIVYRNADGILFNSPQEESAFRGYYDIGDKPTQAIYLGVDIPKITPGERQKQRRLVRRNLKIPEDGKIILYIGRLVKRKKVDRVIEAISRLGDKKIYGIIIGKGVEKEALRKLAPQNVIFLGFVKDTGPYFLAADLFITVSVAEGGFLLSGLEAASWGLPLVLSPSAAGFPIVREGVNGYIVNPDDIGDLVEKINKILQSGRPLGRESRKIARKFSWRQTAQKTAKFYSKVIFG